MTVSRRKFIQGSLVGVGTVGAIGAGTVVSQTKSISNDHNHSSHGLHGVAAGKSYDPSKDPNRVRKNWYDLTDDEVKTFHKALDYMRNKYPLQDPLQWDNYAKIHALHCTEPTPDHPPVHWSWNFLPWHTGYLYFTERILANILTTVYKIDGNKFAMPYWEWSFQRGMPNTREREARGWASPYFGYNPKLENMVNDDGLGFDNSALYDGNRAPTIQRSQMDPRNEFSQDSKDHVIETLNYMSPQYLNLMLAAPWDAFMGLDYTGQRTQQGLLEQGPHNDGHDWVGTRFGKNRTMGTLRTAAADPIFYAHHANIDRIYTLYNTPMPQDAAHANFGKQSYNFLDVDGSTITMTVSEIITKIKPKVTYTPGYVPLAAPTKAVRGPVTTQTVIVDGALAAKPIKVAVPENFSTQGTMLVEVDFETISDTEKYIIRVFAGDKWVGRINWMDGDYRQSYQNKKMIHTFTLLMTSIPPGTRELTFVPPNNSKLKLTFKDLRYRPL